MQEFCGLDALAHAHAGDGFVQHQEIRILDQQHADFQPLLLAVAEEFSPLLQVIGKKDSLRDFLHPFAYRRIASERQCAEHGTTLRV